jgi:hypothetical protein
VPCVAGTFGTDGVKLDVGLLPLGQPPGGSLKLYRALVDTGASRTCVSDRLVAFYRFPPYKRAVMNHAWGSNETYTYQFTLYIPTRLDGYHGGNFTGDVSVFELEGMEFKAKSDFDLLIGRDFLTRGSFKMDFDGHFCICF